MKVAHEPLVFFVALVLFVTTLALPIAAGAAGNDGASASNGSSVDGASNSVGNRAFRGSSETLLNFGTTENSQGSRSPSHKLLLRTDVGTISNVGTVSGSGSTFGGFNFGLIYMFMEQLAAGVAYKAELGSGTVPMKGFDIFGRYYYLGSGTSVQISDGLGDVVQKQRKWNPYGGIEFSNRSYSVALDSTAETSEARSVSGTLSAINGLVGVDYRLSRHWEATTELDLTLMAFSGTDPRVKIRWMLIHLGVNYVF